MNNGPMESHPPKVTRTRGQVAVKLEGQRQRRSDLWLREVVSGGPNEVPSSDES